MIFNNMKTHSLMFVALLSFSTSCLSEGIGKVLWYQPDSEILDSSKNQALQLVNTRREMKNSKSIINRILNSANNTINIPLEKTPPGIATTSDVTLYFASFSMTKSEIKAVFQASSIEGGVVSFRGLKDETKTIGDLISSVHKIANEMNLEVMPNVTLNPNLFDNYKVTKVPTIVIHKKGASAFKVSGLSSAAWLKEKINEYNDKQEKIEVNKLIDFGVYGPIRKIKEKSIIDVMKERALAYDWESAQKRAKEAYMKNIKFLELPRAQEDKLYTLDMSMKVTKDIFDKQGNLIAAKGAVIDPAEHINLTKYIVIFDGTNDKEIDFAKAVWKKADLDRKGIKFVVTKFSLENGGWDDLQKLRNQFGGSIAKLEKNFKRRFKIKSTPSVIFMEDGVVKLKEVRLSY